MLIRDATPADWPAIWGFGEPIVRAGETFSRNPATTEMFRRL